MSSELTKIFQYKAIFFVISDSNFELFLASQILSMNKDIVNETKKIIDLLKILNSKIVGNVAQLLEIKKCLKIFHFPQKRLTTLMRRSFCNKCHKVFYVDSETVLSRSRRAP